MQSRYGRGPHDDDPYGHPNDRARDRARQFGARDGEGGSWGERRYPEPEIFDAEHDFRQFDPDADRSQWERSRVMGPRYERDEGFDRDRDNARFANDPARHDRATSWGRPESFVDAYRRDEMRGRRFDTMPHDRGHDREAVFRNREYSHHLAGVPGYEAAHGVDGWNRWRQESSRPEAGTHPSPYTEHVGPLARRNAMARPHTEDGRGWSGQRTGHDGALGGAWVNPAWEVPFRRDPSTTWGERPHLGKGPRGYVRSDERIREEVCDCLSEGYVDASQVDVDVKDGVVMLTGQVADKSSKRRIEDIAEACRGVQSVDNQLRVQRVTSRGSVGAGTSDAVPSPFESRARDTNRSVS
jgi:hypothetical protein